MKWQSPKDGALRIQRRFAWLPVNLDGDGPTVWLRFYWRLQRYMRDDKWLLSSWHTRAATLTRDAVERRAP